MTGIHLLLPLKLLVYVTTDKCLLVLKSVRYDNVFSDVLLSTKHSIVPICV